MVWIIEPFDSTVTECNMIASLQEVISNSNTITKTFIETFFNDCINFPLKGLNDYSILIRHVSKLDNIA